MLMLFPELPTAAMELRKRLPMLLILIIRPVRLKMKAMGMVIDLISPAV